MAPLFERVAPRANGGPAVQGARRDVVVGFIKTAVQAIARFNMRPLKLVVGKQLFARVGKFRHGFSVREPHD